MKKLCILIVLFGVTFNTTQAQLILKPAEPNEVCMEAWQNYHKADVLWKTGWGLFGGGLVMASLGAGCGTGTAFGVGARPPEERDSKLIAMNKFWWSLCYIGSASVVASVPCLIVGQVRRKAAICSYDEVDCESFLSCEQINSYYRNNNALWKAGWGLFGSGIGLTVLGTLFVLSPTSSKNASVFQKSGFALIGIGGGAGIASIPCLAVGQVRRKSAAKLYNEKCCSEQPILSFSLQTSSNGLGIAMQF